MQMPSSLLALSCQSLVHVLALTWVVDNHWDDLRSPTSETHFPKQTLKKKVQEAEQAGIVVTHDTLPGSGNQRLGISWTRSCIRHQSFLLQEKMRQSGSMDLLKRRKPLTLTLCTTQRQDHRTSVCWPCITEQRWDQYGKRAVSVRPRYDLADHKTDFLPKQTQTGPIPVAHSQADLFPPAPLCPSQTHRPIIPSHAWTGRSWVTGHGHGALWKTRNKSSDLEVLHALPSCPSSVSSWIQLHQQFLLSRKHPRKEGERPRLKEQTQLVLSNAGILLQRACFITSFWALLAIIRLWNLRIKLMQTNRSCGEQ